MSTCLTKLNIVMLDFFLSLRCELSALPKALGLTATLRKGRFPCIFCIPANFDYVGAVPDLQYFDRYNLGDIQREELLEWHQSMRSRIPTKVYGNYKRS